VKRHVILLGAAGTVATTLLSCSLVFPVPDADSDEVADGDADAGPDLRGGQDATSSVADGASTSAEAGLAADATAATDGPVGDEPASDFAPPTVAGLSGIAVLGSTLFAGSAAGVVSCALPGCTSFVLAYPQGTPATRLTAGAQHLGWVVLSSGDDVPTVQVADGVSEGSQAFGLTGGAVVEQLAIARDVVTSLLVVVARRTDGTTDSIAAYGDGEPLNGYSFVAASSSALGSSDDELLVASSLDPYVHRWVKSGGTWTETMPAFSFCSGTCSEVSALASSDGTTLYVAETAGTADLIEDNGADAATVDFTGSGRIGFLYKSSSALAWTETSGGGPSTVYACETQSAVGDRVVCQANTVGTAVVDSLASDGLWLYLADESAGTISRLPLRTK
jgi:hypothetical protein